LLPIDSKYNTHHKLCFIFDTKFYKKQGVWTMGSTALIEDDWDLLRLVTERIHPHKELKLTDILKDRK
jgi:hypothetical protein